MLLNRKACRRSARYGYFVKGAMSQDAPSGAASGLHLLVMFVLYVVLQVSAPQFCTRALRLHERSTMREASLHYDAVVVPTAAWRVGGKA